MGEGEGVEAGRGGVGGGRRNRRQRSQREDVRSGGLVAGGGVPLVGWFWSSGETEQRRSRDAAFTSSRSSADTTSTSAGISEIMVCFVAQRKKICKENWKVYLDLRVLTH